MREITLYIYDSLRVCCTSTRTDPRERLPTTFDPSNRIPRGTGGICEKEGRICREIRASVAIILALVVIMRREKDRESPLVEVV